jgi:hypothetical protein
LGEAMKHVLVLCCFIFLCFVYTSLGSQPIEKHHKHKHHKHKSKHISGAEAFNTSTACGSCSLGEWSDWEKCRKV